MSEDFELHEYTIELPSGEVTVQLTDKDAQARGLKRAVRAERKSRVAANKAAEPENKSRTTAQKRAEVAERSFGGRKSQR